MTNILATGIKSSTHLAIFDQIAEYRFASLDLTPLYIYMIDSVPAQALPALAEQFDVTGYKGWFLTTTDDDRRELIKNAIELHRHKGTPYAIKQALKSVGYGGASISEGTQHLMNGFWNMDGEFTMGSTLWPNFSIAYDLGEEGGITAISLFQMGELVKIYKNVRSRLVDISFTASILDEVDDTDDPGVIYITGADYSDNVQGTYYMDGTYHMSGTIYPGLNEIWSCEVVSDSLETLPFAYLSMSGFALANGHYDMNSPFVQTLTDSFELSIIHIIS